MKKITFVLAMIFAVTLAFETAHAVTYQELQYRYDSYPEAEQGKVKVRPYYKEFSTDRSTYKDGPRFAVVLPAGTTSVSFWVSTDTVTRMKIDTNIPGLDSKLINFARSGMKRPIIEDHFDELSQSRYIRVAAENGSTKLRGYTVRAWVNTNNPGYSPQVDYSIVPESRLSFPDQEEEQEEEEKAAPRENPFDKIDLDRENPFQPKEPEPDPGGSHARVMGDDIVLELYNLPVIHANGEEEIVDKAIVVLTPNGWRLE